MLKGHLAADQCTLDPAVVDEVIAVSDVDAFATARKLARTEGIIAGASSGAALHAALAIAGRPKLDGRMIVVILPDTGERYITTDLFAAGPDPEGSAS